MERKKPLLSSLLSSHRVVRSKIFFSFPAYLTISSPNIKLNLTVPPSICPCSLCRGLGPKPFFLILSLTSFSVDARSMWGLGPRLRSLCRGLGLRRCTLYVAWLIILLWPHQSFTLLAFSSLMWIGLVVKMVGNPSITGYSFLSWSTFSILRSLLSFARVQRLNIGLLSLVIFAPSLSIHGHIFY